AAAAGGGAAPAPAAAAKPARRSGGAYIGGDAVRPAIAVKIDNVVPALPQSGIAQADLVYEEIVEYQLTRLVAVFQSKLPDPVGPVRSARTSDPYILGSLNTPLFAYSGGNAGVKEAVAGAALADVGSDNVGEGGGYYRDSRRKSPHNLFVHLPQLLSAPASKAPGVAGPQFAYRGGDGPPGGSARPARGVQIDFGVPQVRYTWNGQGWERERDGRATVDAGNGATVAPPNVIVQFIEYGVSDADYNSPEAIMSGSGEAWIFTAGQVIQGRWSRPSIGQPTRFTDAGGAPVELTPGATWVALPEPGRAQLLE
ncbi:MAG: DUF3048 domain-containing protein, partial [Acidimicrobiales bacterium]